ncbi:MAG TPA: CNNM domain-containing protein [Gemmatimonadaceae bacterium]
MISPHAVLLSLCILIVALLTAGGMAMRSVSRIWLRHLVEQELRGSRAAHAYLERPQRLIIAASATVALVLVLSGGFLATDYARQPARLALALAVYAAAMIVVGQLLPRAIARRFAPTVASLLSPLLQAAAIVTTPFVAASRIVSRPFERVKQGGEGVERDPIQDLLREGELEGVGEREEMEIITGVLSFGEKLVRDVMIPRDEIFAIERSATAREIAEEFATSAFSRVPVYERSIDHIVGMVHAFDVLKLAGERPPGFRPVATALDSTPCSELLFRLLRRSQHLAIVKDEQQRTVGLVTMEDLLEELVGDIRDEHDEPAPRGEA